ncbi:hypothetical protein BHE74_00010455 [Ensete ventricosum]|nr:hypothetical protein BHE74_00010455 [Ensete ventricosum]
MVGVAVVARRCSSGSREVQRQGRDWKRLRQRGAQRQGRRQRQGRSARQVGSSRVGGSREDYDRGDVAVRRWGRSGQRYNAGDGDAAQGLQAADEATTAVEGDDAIDGWEEKEEGSGDKRWAAATIVGVWPAGSGCGSGESRGGRVLRLEAAVVEEERKAAMIRLRRGGNGCVAAMRAASGGFAWPRKDNDDRREEAVGVSVFGAAIAAGEMGIWWLAAAVGRKKVGRCGYSMSVLSLEGLNLLAIMGHGSEVIISEDFEHHGLLLGERLLDDPLSFGFLRTWTTIWLNMYWGSSYKISIRRSCSLVGSSRLGSTEAPEISASFYKRCVEIVVTSLLRFLHKVTCFFFVVHKVVGDDYDGLLLKGFFSSHGRLERESCNRSVLLRVLLLRFEVLRASWFNLSSCSRAKEIAVVIV